MTHPTGEDSRFLRRMTLRLMLPSMCVMLCLALSNVVDSLVLGIRLRENGLAAVSLTLPIYMVYNVLDLALSTGGSLTYVRLLTEGRAKEARAHFSEITLLAVLMSVPFVLLGIFFTPQVVRLLGAHPKQGEVYLLAQGYAHILLLAAPLFFLKNVLYEFIRNDDGEKLAAFGFITGTAVDFVLNFVFVLGLDMGVRGAILATVCGQVISLFIYAVHLLLPQSILRFSPEKPDFRRIGSSLRIGFAGSSKYGMQFIYLLCANRLLIGMFDAEGVAIFDLILNIGYIVFAIFDGAQSTVQPLAATLAGEQNIAAAKRIFILTTVTGMLLTAAGLALCISFAPLLCALFGLDSADVAKDAAASLRIYLLSVLPAGLNMMLGSYEQALGRKKLCFLMTLLRNFAVQIPVMMIFCLLRSISQFYYFCLVTELLSTVIWLIGARISGQSLIGETDALPTLHTGLYGEDADIGRLLNETAAFCEKWNADKKQTYFTTLTVEEVCTAILANTAQFSRRTRNRLYIQITLIAKPDGDFELHLRDNARSFNPFSMYTRRFRRTDAEKDTDTLGILIVKEKAKQFFYRRYLGFNVLVITV